MSVRELFQGFFWGGAVFWLFMMCFKMAIAPVPMPEREHTKLFLSNFIPFAICVVMTMALAAL